MTSQNDNRLRHLLGEQEEAVRNIAPTAQRTLEKVYARLDLDVLSEMALASVKEEARLRQEYVRSGNDEVRRRCIAKFVENHFLMEESARRILNM